MLRIGDVDVFGAEVNSASKLGEDIAGSGEILVTKSVKDNIPDMPDISFVEVHDVFSWIKRAFKLVY